MQCNSVTCENKLQLGVLLKQYFINGEDFLLNLAVILTIMVMSTALKTMELVKALVNGPRSDVRRKIKEPQKFKCMVVKNDTF